MEIYKRIIIYICKHKKILNSSAYLIFAYDAFAINRFGILKGNVF